MYIYVCSHAGICIHTHIDIHVEHTNMCVCSSARVFMCACVRRRLCVCTDVNKYVWIYIYVCTHAGICIHTRIDIYGEHPNMCVCVRVCACVCVKRRLCVCMDVHK